MPSIVAPGQRRLSDSGLDYTQLRWNATLDFPDHSWDGDESKSLLIPQEYLRFLLQTIARERGRHDHSQRRDRSQEHLEGLHNNLSAEIERYEAELNHWDQILRQTDDQYIRARCADLNFHIEDLKNAVEDVKELERHEHAVMESFHLDTDLENSQMNRYLDFLLVSQGYMHPELNQNESFNMDHLQPFPPELFDGPKYSTLKTLERVGQAGGHSGSQTSHSSVVRTHTRPELWPERSWRSSEDDEKRATRLIDEAQQKFREAEEHRPRGTSIYYSEDLKSVGLHPSEPPRSPTDQETIAFCDRERVRAWLKTLGSDIASNISIPSLQDWPAREPEGGEDEEVAANYRYLVAQGENRQLIDDWAESCRRNAPVEYEEALNEAAGRPQSIPAAREEIVSTSTQDGQSVPVDHKEPETTETARQYIAPPMTWIDHAFWIQFIRGLLIRFLGGGPIEPF